MTAETKKKRILFADQRAISAKRRRGLGTPGNSHSRAASGTPCDFRRSACLHPPGNSHSRILRMLLMISDAPPAFILRGTHIVAAFAAPCGSRRSACLFPAQRAAGSSPTGGGGLRFHWRRQASAPQTLPGAKPLDPSSLCAVSRDFTFARIRSSSSASAACARPAGPRAPRPDGRPSPDTPCRPCIA